MSDIAIQIRDLGKLYALGGNRKPYKTLRESVTDTMLAPFRQRNRYTTNDNERSFWALKDINFQVRSGEVVGIIGRNGAGKSTLLKVLSRITDPTEGEIDINGRVGSLLEVGTGFHPELTGRENIYLNGAILGMKRWEVIKKFDEIVAFAETEKFLDTPVKFYSSGMYTRLAFAVAAHLEPEILVVDEVLAVGDMAFQKKCLGKMSDVARHGRTVLFVSHNMSAIQALCSRCLVLKQGQLHLDAPTGAAVESYLRDASVSATFTRPPQPNGRPTVIAGQVSLADASADPIVQFDLNVTSDIERRVSLDLRISDGTGFAFGLASLGSFDRRQMIHLKPGVNHIVATIAAGQLAIGSYLVSVDVHVPWTEYLDRLENCLAFDVTRPPREGFWLALDQKWAKGCYEVPAQLIGVTSVEGPD